MYDEMWELWKRCLAIAEDRIAICDAAAARFEEGDPARAAEMCAGIEARYITIHIRELEPVADV